MCGSSRAGQCPGPGIACDCNDDDGFWFRAGRAQRLQDITVSMIIAYIIVVVVVVTDFWVALPLGCFLSRKDMHIPTGNRTRWWRRAVITWQAWAICLACSTVRQWLATPMQCVVMRARAKVLASLTSCRGTRAPRGAALSPAHRSLTMVVGLATPALYVRMCACLLRWFQPLALWRYSTHGRTVVAVPFCVLFMPLPRGAALDGAP